MDGTESVRRLAEFIMSPDYKMQILKKLARKKKLSPREQHEAYRLAKDLGLL